MSGSVSSLAIAATSAVKAEGNSGSTAFTFTVTRSGATNQASTADWAVTSSGANQAGASDFTNSALPSGIVTFAPGETSKVVTVWVAGDSVVESDEGFAVTLSNASAGTAISAASATGTIQNDDALYILYYDGSDKPKSFEDNAIIAFSVQRGGGGDLTSYSSVDWEVVASGYNPVAPNDFFGNILPRGTVSFEPSRFQSQDMEKIYIYLNKDSPSLISSEDKTFDVILTNPSPGSEIKSGISPGLILTRNTDRIFTPIDGQLGDGFGSSSALSRDGRSLIIGGPRDDVDGRSEQGSAYVFFLEWGSVDSTRLNFNSI